MSDLAPFVAASLRDRVVMEMNDELQRETNANTILKSVQILSSSTNGDENVESDDDDDDDDDDNNNNSSVPPTLVAQSLISNGTYERRNSFGTSMLWKVNLSSSTQPLVPTLEGLQSLKVCMGGGWFEKKVFGEFSDPHVVPVRYDRTTRTGHFELSAWAAGHVESFGLALRPIRCADDFHQVAGAFPGGLYSRLLAFVQRRRRTPIEIFLQSVSLNADRMRSILNNLGVPPPQRRHRIDADHRYFNEFHALQQAQMEANNAEMRRVTAHHTARAARAQEEMEAQLRQMRQATGARAGRP